MTKRFLSVLLALLMLAPTLAACSESTVNTDTTANETTASQDPAAEEGTEKVPEETELQPDLPAITFNDQTFTFLTSGANDTNGVDWETYDIWVEAMNGDVVNDSVF